MIRAIVAAPFLLLLVLFALSNTETVQLRLWPTDYALDTPLAIAILVAAGLAFLIGACLLWFSAVGARSRLRRSERVRQDLEAEIRALKMRPAPSRAVPVSLSTAPAILPPVSRSGSELTVTR